MVLTFDDNEMKILLGLISQEAHTIQCNIDNMPLLAIKQAEKNPIYSYLLQRHYVIVNMHQKIGQIINDKSAQVVIKNPQSHD